MSRTRGRDSTALARRARRSSTSTARRPSRRRWLLVPAGRRDLPPEPLIARAAPRLARAIEEASRWTGQGASWDIGDFNVLTLLVQLREDLALCVRWRSEPMEPVVVEVCPEDEEFDVTRSIDRNARRLLRRLGYRARGGKRGFQKLVGVGEGVDAAAMAREALTIACASGYRGRTPLRLELLRDRRGRPAVVHDALTPEDVVRLVMASGDLAEVKVSPSGHPVVFASGDSPWLVHLPWRTRQPDLFGGLHFYRLVPRPAVLDAEIINRINGGLLFGKIVIDEDGDLAVSMDVRVDGGVTTDWLAGVLRQWREVAADVEARLTEAKEDLATMAAAAQIVSAKGLLQE